MRNLLEDESSSYLDTARDVALRGDLPKVLLVADVTAGAVKLAWLRALKVSNLSWKKDVEVMRKSFRIDASKLLIPVLSYLREGLWQGAYVIGELVGCSGVERLAERTARCLARADRYALRRLSA